VQAFRDIPGSEIIHRSCNKHELTWSNLGERRRSAA
jgi:hypothetical protein